MYTVRIIYNDYNVYDVEVEGAELNDFMSSFYEGKPYMKKDGSVGFWAPTSNIRCVYLVENDSKKKDKVCQENQNSVVENDLQA